MLSARRHRPLRWGSLALAPVSSNYGFDRGLPVDRWYVEHYLKRFAGHPGYAGGSIQGRVLEIGGREYADKFGAPAREPAIGVVHRVDVLHENDSNPEATIVGDLTQRGTLPEAVFDCIICTHTLHVIFDVRSALAELRRGLKPGGVLLLTAPGITRSCVPDRDAWGDWWRFTSQSLRRLAEEHFEPRDVTVEAYGNVLTATAFLYGLAAGELKESELTVRDPDFEVVIGLHARAPGR